MADYETAQKLGIMTGGWAGIERALREQMIREGFLKPENVKEADSLTGEELVKALETAEEFERTFTESALGLALNVGEKGRIIVKRCVADSPAGRRRIPDGCFVTKIGEQTTDYHSLAQVKTMIQNAERPVKICFAQSDVSRAFAERSHRRAAEQLEKQEEQKQAVIEARKQAEIDRHTCELETSETFSRTFECARTGMCLGDGGGKGKTYVSKCIPGSAAFKAGLPKGAVIVAINGKSTEFRRFKEVKKLVEIATRPVTISYSLEETPTFPKTERKPREGVPSYALRPT